MGGVAALAVVSQSSMRRESPPRRPQLACDQMMFGYAVTRTIDPRLIALIPALAKVIL
jgi:hypothetical protein